MTPIPSFGVLFPAASLGGGLRPVVGPLGVGAHEEVVREDPDGGVGVVERASDDAPGALEPEPEVVPDVLHPCGGRCPEVHSYCVCLCMSAGRQHWTDVRRGNAADNISLMYGVKMLRGCRFAVLVVSTTLECQRLLRCNLGSHLPPD